MFKRWLLRWADRIREDSMLIEVEPSRKRRGFGKLNAVPSTRRVEHNYDDRGVITFKVFGANGGMIVETARYDEKRDTEGINRYVISDDANLAESLGKIVTIEYLK